MSAALRWLAVAALGGLGAVLRVALATAVDGRSGGAAAGLPLGTLAVNVSGSALLGLLAGLALDGDALLLAGTALLGGYTTFSTWMVDAERLARGGMGRAAALDVVGGLALGLAALALGHALGAAL